MADGGAVPGRSEARAEVHGLDALEALLFGFDVERANEDALFVRLRGMTEIEEVVAVREEGGIALKGVTANLRDGSGGAAGGRDAPDWPGVVSDQDDAIGAPGAAEQGVGGIAQGLRRTAGDIDLFDLVSLLEDQKAGIGGPEYRNWDRPFRAGNGSRLE